MVNGSSRVSPQARTAVDAPIAELGYVPNRAARSLVVDGVLLILLHGDGPMPQTITAAGVPLVVMGRPLTGAAVDFVDADNVDGARHAVGRLLAVGRRRLATVAGPTDMSVGASRRPSCCYRGRPTSTASSRRPT